jgi:hypothetical protein
VRTRLLLPQRLDDLLDAAPNALVGRGLLDEFEALLGELLSGEWVGDHADAAHGAVLGAALCARLLLLLGVRHDAAEVVKLPARRRTAPQRE